MSLIKVSRKVKKQLKYKAKRQGITINQVVEQLLLYEDDETIVELDDYDSYVEMFGVSETEVFNKLLDETTSTYEELLELSEKEISEKYFEIISNTHINNSTIKEIVKQEIGDKIDKKEYISKVVELYNNSRKEL